MEKETFTLIGTYQYSSEALIYKGRLEAEEIEVYIRDNNTVDTNPMYSNAVGGVKLFVKQDDFYKAKSILEQISKSSLDDDNKLIHCPNCNTADVNLITTIKDKKTFLGFISVFLFGGLPLFVNYLYQCNSCGYQFEIKKTENK
ncbi:DUF2007 domain-containing protein [uncultured Flavobacterium sp.]|jgi:hypothetical protein|uniref:DUF2007 domain-containing protein n=1 Tax=uncultured Flavobacterium sp. TaxID=165435 RepID=UPI002591E644|nr:DUF2007 domain-containing protein [uncultured Flavobacterium sp.]